MEHVLFVIIYAAMLSTHSLFALATFPKNFKSRTGLEPAGNVRLWLITEWLDILYAQTWVGGWSLEVIISDEAPYHKNFLQSLHSNKHLNSALVSSPHWGIPATNASLRRQSKAFLHSLNFRPHKSWRRDTTVPSVLRYPTSQGHFLLQLWGMMGKRGAPPASQPGSRLQPCPLFFPPERWKREGHGGLPAAQ